MATYQMENKRIPVTLPRENVDDFPSALVPKEEECRDCKMPLHGLCEITRCAMIIGVTKVKKGEN